MANITLAGITLPPDMLWDDEFKWSDVKQLVTPSVTGATLIQANARQSGRPITLKGEMEGRVGYALIQRSVVEAIRNLETAAMTTMTLTFSDGRSFPVVFRYEGGVAFTADPMKHKDPPLPEDYYEIQINLMVV